MVSGGQQNEIPTNIFSETTHPFAIHGGDGGWSHPDDSMLDEAMADMLFGSSAAATEFMENLLEGQFSGMPTAKHLLLIPELLSDRHKRLVYALAADKFQHMYMTNEYGVVPSFLEGLVSFILYGEKLERYGVCGKCLVMLLSEVLRPDVHREDYVTWVCVRVARACSGEKFSAHSLLFEHTNRDDNWLILKLSILATRWMLHVLHLALFFISKLRHCLVFLLKPRL
ncbi:delta-1-pyrroline-5-carboxylate dehydrogenase 1 protein [Striga asiatica]|uniref:Delta-1-pyrroline-5-carboxylate dehydrogenase 1 protein n=1 Tax=Striga asiatica TaxID=4170 RepID=A0A5A7P4R7_STRAF|nr:delta-1-pyrroline-5-carboxylate dehydrogenase 1 protein [Striga asiatica]